MKHSSSVWASSVLIVFLCALCGISAFGKEYRFISGATDWSKPASYSTDIWSDAKPSEVLPGLSDTVYVMAGVKAVLSCTNAESWAAAANIGAIKTHNPNCVLEIETPTDATFAGGLAYDKTWANVVNREKGKIVKRGAGTLTLTHPRNCSYFNNFVIEEGAVVLPQNVRDDVEVAHYGQFFLAEGTTLRLPKRENGTAPSARFDGLSGTGSIAADMATSIGVNGPYESTFEGVIPDCCRISSGADFVLKTPNNRTTMTTIHNYDDITGKIVSDGDGNRREVYLSVERIGKIGEPSPIGTNRIVYVGENTGKTGGGIRYIGTGETTDKTLRFDNSQNSPGRLDGGPHGGLVWSGQLLVNAYVPGWDWMVFSGDNTNECRFTGSVVEGTGDTPEGGRTNYNFYVSKRGTGTWSFEGTKAFTGGFAIEDGTLKFDSLDEKGKASPLGTATVLTKPFAGFLSDDVMVSYAYLLGGTNAAGRATGKGLLEYAGTNSVRTTTRPAVLNGCGGFANNGTGSFRFAGVTGVIDETVDNTLVLSGSGEGGNEVQDVAGPLSVVKEGPGTWFLGGSNTFSGTLEVKAGTLWVRDPAKYTWFKWLVHETTNHFYQVQATEFGLFDSANVRQNANLRSGGNCYQLAPGECGFGWVHYMAYDVGTLPDLFDDTASARVLVHAKTGPSGDNITATASDPETWYPYVMRLTNGAPEIASYDFTILGWHDGQRACTPAVWSVEASTDGIRWDEVIGTTEDRSTYGEWNNWWRFSGKAYTDGDAAVHAGGAPIPGRKTSGVLPVLNNVGFVSVAPGATLKTDAGADLKLSKVRVDAAGAASGTVGTIENFGLAASGTLDVTGLGKDSPSSIDLPIAFVGTDMSSLSDWNLTVDGASTGKWTMTVTEDGKIRLNRTGLVLIVR